MEMMCNSFFKRDIELSSARKTGVKRKRRIKEDYKKEN